MKREHIYYFDYLRIFAMISVIFMHTAATPLRAEAGASLSWKALNVCTSLAFSAVPLFFMMSGYLTLSQDMSGKDYITKLCRRRLPRLLLPLMCWTLLAVLEESLLTGQWTLSAIGGKLISGLHTPVMVHFWYMYTLIPIFIIAPLLSGIAGLDKTGRRFFFGLILLCTAYTACNQILALWGWEGFVLDLPGKLLSWGAGGYLLSFLLGYLLGSGKKRAPASLLLTGPAAVFALIAIGTQILTRANGQYTQTLQKQSSGLEVFLAAGIFLLFKERLNKKSPVFPGLVSTLSQLSLPIYLMHNVLLDILYLSNGIWARGFKKTCLFTVLNLAVCCVTLKTAATVKPLCYLLTGLTYEEACGSCNWIFTYRRIKGKL